MTSKEYFVMFSWNSSEVLRSFVPMGVRTVKTVSFLWWTYSKDNQDGYVGNYFYKHYKLPFISVTIKSVNRLPANLIQRFKTDSSASEEKGNVPLRKYPQIKKWFIYQSGTYYNEFHCDHLSAQMRSLIRGRHVGNKQANSSNAIGWYENESV